MKITDILNTKLKQCAVLTAILIASFYNPWRMFTLKIKSALLSISIAALLSGCGGSGSTMDSLAGIPGLSGSTDTISSNGGTSINLIDIDAFDKELSNSMSSNLEKIEVTSVSPLQMDKIPERLKKWLSVLSNYKGKVDVEPKSRALSLTSIAAVVAPIAYSYLKEQLTYLPVKNYNATLYYTPETNILEKVVFTRKANAPTTPATGAGALMQKLPSLLP